jgi:hypothetical protein
MILAKNHRDILRDCMHNDRTRTLSIAIIFLISVVVALFLASPGAALQSLPASPAAAVAQAATPTAMEEPQSVAGSTDGIVWMGAVIVAIILLPIVFQRATWH